MLMVWLVGVVWMESVFELDDESVCGKVRENKERGR
jgi:hypothetical protein